MHLDSIGDWFGIKGVGVGRDVDVGAAVEGWPPAPGIDGRELLSGDTSRWLAGLQPQPAPGFRVHLGQAAQRAARALGAAAFTRGDAIFIGDVPPARLQQVLRHELVHLAQVQWALRTGRIAARAAIEAEADAISALPSARPVACGASPEASYPIIWFVAIGIGLYVLFRPGVANAPGPGDRVYKSPSAGQVIAEALCIFAVPGGALALGGRLGLGFLGSAALAGATTNVSLRAVGDAAGGTLSPPLMYLFDAVTGAVLGYVVPGGLRLLGRAGTQALDQLAAFGLRRSDIALTGMLAEEAAKAPLTAAAAQRILQARGLAGQISKWWINRRGMIVLYRGQEIATDRVLSPLAREQGVAASEALVQRLRSMGMSFEDIAGYTARWHTEPIPSMLAPPGLGGVPIGSVGIPTTRIPGVAADFGEGGVIYVIRIPKEAAIRPLGWQGLLAEDEFVVLNEVPAGGIIKAIPVSDLAPLLVDANGLLVPGGVRP